MIFVIKGESMIKNLIFIISIILCIIPLNAEENLTIYNDNFAVFRTKLEIQLEKGLQSYLYSDIPAQIEPISLIFKSKDDKIKLHSQNYEYDLANSDTILNKYLNSNITVCLKDNSEYSGTLTFFDFNAIGLQDDKSKELYLINKSEFKSIKLANLPGNFYIKPTLNWLLDSPAKGKYPIDISYITKGLSWFITYNAVLKNNTLQISPWVSINNHSGRSYNSVNLKLLAGDVAKRDNYRRSDKLNVMEMTAMGSPTFQEKDFSDYHLYTLDQKASVADKQVKQMLLFEPKTVNVKKIYKYQSNALADNKVQSVITFKNSKKNGLGIPLPTGIVKVYQVDDSDGNLEFIGEDNISHTSLDQEVSVNIGNAFDIIAKTKIVKDNTIRNDREQEFELTIENKKKEAIKIFIMHTIGYNDYQIIEKNFDFINTDAYTITIEKNIKGGETAILRWVQRVKRR
jgi:hypothetical protein